MEQPPPLTIPEPATPPPASTSLVARLLNVFAAPSEVFDQVKVAPQAVTTWLVPALLFMATSWFCGWLIFSQDSFQHQMREISEKALDQQIQKMHLPKEKADEMREAMGKFGNVGVRISMVAGPAVGAFLPLFLWGLVLWLVGTKILKGNFEYMKG